MEPKVLEAQTQFMELLFSVRDCETADRVSTAGSTQEQVSEHDCKSCWQKLKYQNEPVELLF